jgi:hypothetical protein
MRVEVCGHALAIDRRDSFSNGCFGITVNPLEIGVCRY